MPELEDAVHAYAAAWNEPDETRRRELVASCWADTGTLTSPAVHYVGREALLEDIAKFHRERPGWRAIFTSGLDTHHNVTRFSVAIVDGTDNAVAEGLDIAEIGSNGLLTRIITFWGTPPTPPEKWPRRLVAQARRP
jgi:hypothetical protein